VARAPASGGAFGSRSLTAIEYHLSGTRRTRLGARRRFSPRVAVGLHRVRIAGHEVVPALRGGPEPRPRPPGRGAVAPGAQRFTRAACRPSRAGSTLITGTGGSSDRKAFTPPPPVFASLLLPGVGRRLDLALDVALEMACTAPPSSSIFGCRRRRGLDVVGERLDYQLRRAGRSRPHARLVRHDLLGAQGDADRVSWAGEAPRPGVVWGATGSRPAPPPASGRSHGPLVVRLLRGEHPTRGLGVEAQHHRAGVPSPTAPS